MLIPCWDRLKGGLQDSLDVSGEGYTLDDIEEMILKGKANWHTNGKCAIITKILELPVGDVCLIWWSSGPLDQVFHFGDTTVRKWAKDIGCVKAVISARKGWKKAPGDWKEKTRLYEMEL